MQIVFSKSSAKTLNRIDSSTCRRILQGIQGLIKQPPEGDIKALSGILKGKHRLRIGDWRVIYTIADDILSIGEILPRGEAYKRSDL